jgi:hypothetical protein
MKVRTVFTMSLLTLFNGLSAAQTAPTLPTSPTSPSAVVDSLKDLDALTLSCSRAALNAAAREAAKVQARGTYQFSYFNIVSQSHQARYEVHFQSNYQGEPDLKYCVVLYCQQGWDPAQVEAKVNSMSARPVSATSARCAEPTHMTAQHRKSATAPVTGQ